METILYTNNKREGSNYQVDRTVYAERIDVNHLLQNQLDRCKISRVHFWFIKENISSIEDNKEDTLLIKIGKYLMDQSNFKCQYIVQKYHLNDSQNASITKQELIKQEIVFTHARQYEKIIKKEMQNSFDRQVIKKYRFQNQEHSITVSLFQLHQKHLVAKIIEDQCNQIYNAKLHYRKMSTIHPQNYEKKKIEQIQQPMQMYHKLILYLFYTQQKLQETQLKRRKMNKANLANQIVAQSLASWKVKEEAQSLAKYEKECELIKQQIENEKIIFRNKIKVIQNYIGDTINVQKLYLEEEEVGTNNQLLGSPTFKKVPHLTKRSSIAPAINQAITNNIQKLNKYNNTTNTLNTFMPVPEFKRLKDMNEAMRNIDNTLFDQSKKIQQLRIKVKELKRSKQQLLYKQAKELNAIKKDLLDLGQEMERKENQIQQKKKNGEFQTFIQYKNKEPSNKAKENLKEHIKFLNNYQKPTPAEQYRPAQTFFKDSSNVKIKQKRLKQVENTINRLKEVQEQHKTINLEHYSLSKRHLQKPQEQLTEMSNLANQLSILYQYYIKNTHIVNSINKQIANYKCLNQFRSWKSQLKPNISQNNSSFLPQCVGQLDLDQFPVLKNIVQVEKIEDDCLPSTKHEKHRSQYTFQSKYPKDCFNLMINIQADKKSFRKEKEQNSQISSKEIEKAEALVIKALSQQSNLKGNHKIWPKASKFKRITIQQAIQTNTLMKKVRINNNEWQNL